MSKRVLVVAMVVLLLASASLVGAWQVEIENKSKSSKDVKVAGSRFLWNEIDCNYPELKPGEKVTCQLPGAICPIYVEVQGTIYWCFEKVPCCWNLRGVIDEGGGSFGLFSYK